jgi:predicted transcriptional regulator
MRNPKWLLKIPAPVLVHSPVSQSTSILEVAKLFLEKRIHRVFVEQNQKLVGVISTSNLLTAMIKSCDC